MCFENQVKNTFLSIYFIKYCRYIRSDSISDCLLEIRRIVFMNVVKWESRSGNYKMPSKSRHKRTSYLHSFS